MFFLNSALFILGIKVFVWKKMWIYVFTTDMRWPIKRTRVETPNCRSKFRTPNWEFPPSGVWRSSRATWLPWGSSSRWLHKRCSPSYSRKHAWASVNWSAWWRFCCKFNAITRGSKPQYSFVCFLFCFCV